MFNGIEELHDAPTILPYDTCSASAGEEDEMRPDDIIKTDLVSEIILLTSGFVIVVTFIFTVIAALFRVPSLP